MLASSIVNSPDSLKFRVCGSKLRSRIDPFLLHRRQTIPRRDYFYKYSCLIDDRIYNIDGLHNAEGALRHFTEFNEVLDFVETISTGDCGS